MGMLKREELQGGVSLTKQASKDETDINFILAGYQQTGVLPFAERAKLAQYGDVSNIGSFQECVNRVKEAESAFMALPATVRDRYANDPAELLAAVDAASNGDPDALAELVQVGVLPAPEASDSTKPSSSPGTAPAAPPAPAAPAAAAAAATASKV